MATSLREITVDGVRYTWWIPGNHVDVDDVHLCVATSKHGQQLRVDPYAWAFEIRPATVAEAIRVGLAHGWTPAVNAPPLYLGLIDGALRPLPAGVQFAHRAR